MLLSDAATAFDFTWLPVLKSSSMGTFKGESPMVIFPSFEDVAASIAATSQNALHSAVDAVLSVAAIMFQMLMFATLFG